MDGPAGLRAALLRYSPQFVQMFVEKLMTYAVGRGMEYTDMPTIRAIARAVEKEDHRFSALVLGVVNSPQFQMRLKTEDGAVRQADRRSSVGLAGSRRDPAVATN
ncbi:hypothetical protein D3C83_24780 [compost metagenome]